MTTDQASAAEQLAAKIRRLVKRETLDRVHGLEIEVRLEVVTLKGRCATFYTKQIAQTVAMGCITDRALSNQIEVVQSDS